MAANVTDEAEFDPESSQAWLDLISDAEKANGKKVPMGRGGKPEEIAALVCWLATDEASYITGQAIVVDGGNSIMEERS